MIGFRLGNLLRPHSVVCLYGELGAGKTTFVKGIAQALGISDRDITSASFTIIAEYDSEIPLYHIDLYRLEKMLILMKQGYGIIFTATALPLLNGLNASERFRMIL